MIPFKHFCYDSTVIRIIPTMIWFILTWSLKFNIREFKWYDSKNFELNKKVRKRVLPHKKRVDTQETYATNKDS